MAKTLQTTSSAGGETTDGPNAELALVLSGVSKSFPGVRALTDVRFDCKPGEVHALVGENGSGKTTLIKIASGVYTPDTGEVLIEGQPLAGGSVNRARKLGLVTAYQDTALVHELSVADNIALSFNAIGKPRPGDLNQVLARYQLPFKPSDSVAALGPGARQLLEVARAMCHQPHVLMLDEPTAALDMQFAAHLEELIRQSRDEGMAIVYVSHRLEEVRRMADRLTVIRDGVIQGTYSSRDWRVDDIVELMVGAPTELEFPKRSGAASETRRLAVRDLVGSSYGPVSLTVRPGEIVGVAGAEGNGQRAVLRGLIGIGRNAGDVSVDGKRIRRHSPAAALDAGISFQSGDRSEESIFLPLSVMDNCTSQLGSDSGPLGTALTGRLRTAFHQASDELGIVAASPYQPISGLSGGNQQKAVLARPTLRKPKVLVVDEPTQGVDARARMDIYRVLAGAADDGIAVLVNSSDSAELAGMCDRVYVMSRGKVVQEITGPTTEAAIVRGFVSATDVDERRAGQVSRSAGLVARWRARLYAHVPIVVLLALTAIVAIYTGTQSNVFWSSQNLANLMLLTLPLACVALGQQFAMISGGFDISVGSTMSLTVVLASMTLPDLTVTSLLRTIPLLLAVGVAIGGFNSFMIATLKVNPIIATIGTLGIVQGIAIVLRPTPAGVIAPSLATGFNKGIGFIPTPFLVIVIVTIALELWLYRSRRGLALRGVGFNAESSRRVGWPVGIIRSGALLLTALGAVVGGIFLASQTGVGSNNVGASYALPCFAAVFLGGAVMTGGRGSFIGALLGAIFLSLLNNVTPLLNIQNSWQQTIYGAILLVAISMYAIAARVRARRGLVLSDGAGVLPPAAS
jgi:ribose transport system ATP-binding protein